MIKKPLKAILHSFLQMPSGSDVLNKSITVFQPQLSPPEDLKLKKKMEVQTKIINLLVENPNDINEVVNKLNGNTFLHEACCEGYYDVVRKLIQLGAKVNAKNSNEDTPLHFASKGDDIDIFSFF